MKREISVLDQNTIDKIAAGEVVERPSSVVKELVENAIDAGASAITVEIRDGGISLIRITDNGSGIEKNQVRKAFLRHATSKIRSVDDLLTISSLGFRGEALSSIAAVSQVELITKPHEELIGVRYVIEGGMEKTFEEIGAPDGTTFLIRNIFYNTPARAKFLKTPTTEAGYISNFIEQLALSHPHIAFKYIQNGQTKLHTSGNDQIKEVIYQIYGRDITRELLDVHYESPDGKLTIEGFIGKPSISRGNRNFENYYVNGRYVKSKIIMKAIEDGYHTFMMQHQYPFTALQIQMDGEDVDINVHPTKMEVRFSHQQEMYQRIYQVITETLSKRELVRETTWDSKPSQTIKKPVPSGNKPATSVNKPVPSLDKAVSSVNKSVPSLDKAASAVNKSVPSLDKAVSSVNKSVPSLNKSVPPVNKPVPSLNKAATPISIPVQPVSDPVPVTNTSEESLIKQVKVPEPFEYERRRQEAEKLVLAEPDKVTQKSRPEQLDLFDGILLSKEAKSHHKIIGQLFDTYWIVQMDEKMYIIDQHAAHEKVMYERITKEIKKREVTSQMVSPPIIISLNLQEEEKLNQFMEYFQSIGFEIELFGGREYSIRAVPQNLFGLTGQDFFIEVLDQLEDTPAGKAPEVILDRMATMACKAAVKGNMRLSATEAKALIDELLELENPYNCPHGRPTIISMTKSELEKKFKRIV